MIRRIAGSRALSTLACMTLAVILHSVPCLAAQDQAPAEPKSHQLPNNITPLSLDEPRVREALDLAEKAGFDRIVREVRQGRIRLWVFDDPDYNQNVPAVVKLTEPDMLFSRKTASHLSVKTFAELIVHEGTHTLGLLDRGRIATEMDAYRAQALFAYRIGISPYSTLRHEDIANLDDAQLRRRILAMPGGWGVYRDSAFIYDSDAEWKAARERGEPHRPPELDLPPRPALFPELRRSAGVLGGAYLLKEAIAWILDQGGGPPFSDPEFWTSALAFTGVAILSDQVIRSFDPFRGGALSVGMTALEWLSGEAGLAELAISAGSYLTAELLVEIGATLLLGSGPPGWIAAVGLGAIKLLLGDAIERLVLGSGTPEASEPGRKGLAAKIEAADGGGGP